jgi:hypothetical protein
MERLPVTQFLLSQSRDRNQSRTHPMALAINHAILRSISIVFNAEAPYRIRCDKNFDSEISVERNRASDFEIADSVLNACVIDGRDCEKRKKLHE